MIKIINGTYKKLSEHFNAYEFRCRCGKKHNIYIDTNLVNLLEKVRTKLGASSCIIYSGYRCSEHDKKVGGSGKGPHTQGYAVDCYFTKNGKRINSKDVCLALEDLGHKKGIGYRCGGSKPATGNTHIDTKPRKWFGDESKSLSRSCCSSFYNYFGIKKTTSVTSKYNLTRLLYKGCKGDDVKELQKELNKKGNKLSVDGIFGTKTLATVKKFQKVNKLSVDGKVGKNTAHKLGWLYNNK